MSKELTPEQIEQIRQREQAATQPPWIYFNDDSAYFPDWIRAERPNFGYPEQEGQPDISGNICKMPEGSDYDFEEHEDNAQFIAHARQDVQDLLAHIDALTVRVEVFLSHLSTDCPPGCYWHCDACNRPELSDNDDDKKTCYNHWLEWANTEAAKEAKG
jgi:hypothetical protein